MPIAIKPTPVISTKPAERGESQRFYSIGPGLNRPDLAGMFVVSVGAVLIGESDDADKDESNANLYQRFCIHEIFIPLNLYLPSIRSK